MRRGASNIINSCRLFTESPLDCTFYFFLQHTNFRAHVQPVEAPFPDQKFYFWYSDAVLLFWSTSIVIQYQFFIYGVVLLWNTPPFRWEICAYTAWERRFQTGQMEVQSGVWYRSILFAWIQYLWRKNVLKIQIRRVYWKWMDRWMTRLYVLFNSMTVISGRGWMILDSCVHRTSYAVGNMFAPRGARTRGW